ncbi:uncharacterized protein LOC18789919 [Prunus persica]|uniref:uncharacterized protein LOC18789919 n=1 Tax=Prunus persica TaxID=3760 RepID=UPI0009AB84AD|nr:uncharacterized protein LOC18789919 [Prunus persica]
MDRASGSIAHPPYFDGNNYSAWKAKMKSFLWSLDERVWSTVVHGFPKPTKKIGKGDEETTILKAREEWTTAEVTHSTNNQKGLNALFTAVSSDQFEYISCCDTSKEAWDILQVTHEGTDTVKGAKLQMHTLQFETLMMDENETFSEFYAKLCVIVNDCSSLGEKIPEDRVVKKILRSLPQRFQLKITAIEEIRDLNTLKVQELIGSIQTYEMKHLAPKKSKNVAFKVVNEEDDGHSNEDCSDEELTILTRRFMNFLKNQDPRSRDSKGINSKNRFVNYTDGGSKFRRSNERKNPREKVQCFECEGYGHISSECANTLKKQRDGKNKAMHTTWSDSESECEIDEKTVALITTVSLDESHEDDDCKGINIEFIMNKYDDLLAVSQKFNKQNSELVKEVAVLKLENSRIANEFQSPDADSEKVSAGMNETLMFLHKKLADQNKLSASLTSDNKALELELKNSKERIVSLTIGAEKIDKMISMGRRDGDKRGLGFEPSNKSSAVSKTKFVKSTSPIEPSVTHEVKKFIPICHFCGTRGHIRPRCNKLRNEFVCSNSHGMGGKVSIQHKISNLMKEVNRLSKLSSFHCLPSTKTKLVWRKKENHNGMSSSTNIVHEPVALESLDLKCIAVKSLDNLRSDTLRKSLGICALD